MATRLRRCVPIAAALCGALGIASLFLPVAGAIVGTLAYAGFGIALWYAFEDPLEPVIRVAIATAALGLFAGAFPFEAARTAGDGAIACALVCVAVVLVRGVRGARAPVPAAAETLGTSRFAWVRGPASAIDRTVVKRLATFVPIAALALSLVLGVTAAHAADGWHMSGGSDGALRWNAAVLTAPLQRDGATLRTNAVVTKDGSAPRIGVVDSPILTVVKLLWPRPLDGPRLVNVLDVLDLFATLACVAWFAAFAVTSKAGGIVAAAVVFALTPIAHNVVVSAPFDLWPAIVVALVAARGRFGPALAGALGVSVLNVANGFELGALLFALAVAGRVATRSARQLTIAGIAGSIVAAWLSRSLAPDLTTYAAWWSSNDVRGLLHDETIAGVFGHMLPAALVLGASWVLAVRRRDAIARAAFAGAALCAVFALPAVLGGVPLLAPSALLAALPLGWPSARILNVAVVLGCLPVAFAVRTAIAARASRFEFECTSAGAIVLALAGLAVSLPGGARGGPVAAVPGTVILELPAAEADSPAAMRYADDILAAGGRVVQPLPYVSTPPRIPAFVQTRDAIAQLQMLGEPAMLVIARDVYANPAERYAEPTVTDPRDYVVPDVSGNPALRLVTLSDYAEIYELTSRAMK